MTIMVHTEFEQGSGQWLQQRCGMLTASEMSLILTPTLKPANNEKERGHLYELMAQRINNHVEPQYVSDAMLRGETEEISARDLYAKHVAAVDQVGFVTNDKLGFRIGFSPDGLVGNDGQIEIKSRSQKYQTQTIIEGAMPSEYLLQVQTGLFVTERAWCDFISYSNGMPMFVLRVYPDAKVHAAIAEAATAFETRLLEKMAIYRAHAVKFHQAPRHDYQDINL